jgi:RNA polymerase sigma-70 factor (ECF subfamily)
VGDAAIADDIVQEAFIKVWNMRDEIRSDTVKALLYKIAGNLSLNQLKHNQVVYNFENNYEQDTYSEQADAKIISDEFNQYLQNVIASIPDNSREVFLMNRMEGLTYEEIATRLDLSVKAIEKRMSEALRIVRSKISYKV